MRILSASEQESFDKPPLFDFPERKKFLEPSRALLDAARGMRDPHHQVGFALSRGYFRATRRFFASADFRDRDLACVATQLGLEIEFPLAYPDRTRQRHQRRIVDLYGFSPLRFQVGMGHGGGDRDDGGHVPEAAPDIRPLR